MVASRYNSVITERLVEGAERKLREAGVPYETVWVPGSFELPQAVAILNSSGNYEGFVVVGCIIRGETSHWEHLAGAVIGSLLSYATTHRVPVGLAVLTVESLEQGLNRAGGKMGNKGEEAAESVLNLLKIKNRGA
ncbi:MAG: 6,7-dimethyl-8-ribityllumazine synthase [Thermotogae bacterium]|nr:6,7-dimethyl-8-ribityllumazine synthase [Thermotogota bacterium]